MEALQVDQRYQRAITENGRKRVRKIAKGFRWARFGALLVAGPDELGDYAVIDGQHRLEAARLLAEDGVRLTHVPCVVVAGAEGSPKRAMAVQAQAFKAVNKDRIGVTRINVFWADLASGDLDAAAVKAVCDAAGVQISRIGTGRQKPLHTTAVAAIARCLKDHGEAAVRTALSCLATAQPEVENAFRGQTVKALCRMVGWSRGVAEGDDPAGPLDPARLTRVLAELDLDSEIEAAQALAKTCRGKVEDALTLRLSRAYNRNLSSKSRMWEPPV